jgi:hypothetical protein
VSQNTLPNLYYKETFKHQGIKHCKDGGAHIGVDADSSFQGYGAMSISK